MRFLFTPIGSGGDVRPFIAVAQKIVAMGHTATVIAAEPFRDATRRAGLDFVSVWPRENYERDVMNPDLWHPSKGMRLVIRILTENLASAWNIVEGAYEEGNTVFVSHALAFPTRAFAEKHGAPSATMHLQPNVFRTIHDQPITIPGVNVNLIPRFMRATFWRLLEEFMIDPLLAPQLNTFRAERGLPPMERVFHTGTHAPDLVLALFPEWFGPRQPDWPPQCRHAGFPIIRNETPVDPELDAWLRAGDPPVVFTAGTANRQATKFFQAAVDAAARLGRRALLLTQWREQLPAELPPGARWSAWAPLAEVLPPSEAFVHHGGIGSCADGFAAGVPQLLMPMAFDQPDNAARLERLGAGRSLPPRKFDGARVAAVLEQLLGDPTVADACRMISERMSRDDGVANAAAALSELAHGRRQPSGTGIARR